jgi:hypothetical protein
LCTKIPPTFKTLTGRRQLIVLVLDDQLVQPVQIVLLEFQPEQGSCHLVRQVVLLGADDAAEDGRLGAFADTLYRRHNVILAMIDLTLAAILAETSMPANVSCGIEPAAASACECRPPDGCPGARHPAPSLRPPVPPRARPGLGPTVARTDRPHLPAVNHGPSGPARWLIRRLRSSLTS